MEPNYFRIANVNFSENRLNANPKDAHQIIHDLARSEWVPVQHGKEVQNVKKTLDFVLALLNQMPSDDVRECFYRDGAELFRKCLRISDSTAEFNKCEEIAKKVPNIERKFVNISTIHGELDITAIYEIEFDKGSIIKKGYIIDALARHSVFFRNMFGTAYKPQKIVGNREEGEEYSTELIQKIIDEFYSEKGLVITPDNVMDLIMSSFYLEFPAIEHKCYEWLDKNMDLESAFNFILLARSKSKKVLDLSGLEKFCVEWLSNVAMGLNPKTDFEKGIAIVNFAQKLQLNELVDLCCDYFNLCLNDCTFAGHHKLFDKVVDIVKHTPLKRIELSFPVDDDYITKLREVTALRSLSITYKRSEPTYLPKISLSGFPIMYLTFLERLEIASCNQMLCLATAFERLPSLRTLKLANDDKPVNSLIFSNINHKAFKEARKLTSLTSLTLRNFDDVNHGIKYLSLLTQLQALELDDTDVEDDTLLQVTHIQMATLALRNSNIFTNRALLHIGAGMSSLTCLTLSGLSDITSAGLPSLRNPLLNSLNLSYCPGINDEGLSILSHHTNLRALDFSGCSSVTDGGIAHLRDATTLRQLDLTGCNVTNASRDVLTSLHLEKLKGFDLA